MSDLGSTTDSSAVFRHSLELLGTHNQRVMAAIAAAALEVPLESVVRGPVGCIVRGLDASGIATRLKAVFSEIDSSVSVCVSSNSVYLR